MRVVSTAEDEATVTISSNDLAFFQSAINETMEALSDNEIEIRTGATMERAQAFIDEIKDIRDAIHTKR
jgi:hypothetical protein